MAACPPFISRAKRAGAFDSCKARLNGRAALTPGLPTPISAATEAARRNRTRPPRTPVGTSSLLTLRGSNVQPSRCRVQTRSSGTPAAWRKPPHILSARRVLHRSCQARNLAKRTPRSAGPARSCPPSRAAKNSTKKSLELELYQLVEMPKFGRKRRASSKNATRTLATKTRQTTIANGRWRSFCTRLRYHTRRGPAPRADLGPRPIYISQESHRSLLTLAS